MTIELTPSLIIQRASVGLHVPAAQTQDACSLPVESVNGGVFFDDAERDAVRLALDPLDVGVESADDFQRPVRHFDHVVGRRPPAVVRRRRRPTARCTRLGDRVAQTGDATDDRVLEDVRLENDQLYTNIKVGLYEQDIMLLKNTANVIKC